MVTQKEFVARYAVRSGITVEELLAFRVAIPASMDWPSCSEPNCDGWHMLPRGFAEEHLKWCVERGLVSPEVLAYLK